MVQRVNVNTNKVLSSSVGKACLGYTEDVVVDQC